MIDIKVHLDWDQRAQAASIQDARTFEEFPETQASSASDDSKLSDMPSEQKPRQKR